MQLRRLVHFVLLFACAFAHAQVDRNAFTFTRYDLQVNVAPADHSFSAKGTITLRNDSSAPQQHASLQISSTLDWKRIDLATKGTSTTGASTTLWKPAQFLSQPYSSDIDHTGELSEAIVYFPATAPGGTVDLRIEYSGTIPRDSTRLTRIGLKEVRAVTADWDTISDTFTAVRGVGYVCWYPVSMDAASLSSGTDVFDALGSWKRRETGAVMKVAMTASVTVTPADVIVANDTPQTSGKGWGGLSSSSSQGASKNFSAGQDLVWDSLSEVVPTFAVGSYSETAEAQGGTVVYHLPGREPAAADYAHAGGSVSQLVAQWFGPRKRSVRIVELADPDALAYDAGPVLFTPLRTIERKTLELILAHQFTHATIDSPRPWIYEGLATFAEALAREQQDGRDGALQFIQSKLPVLARVEQGRNGTDANAAANSLINTSDEVLYRTKAMYCWWMLRDMLGDTPLQKAIRSYRAADDRQPATIQQLLETESKKQLEQFFDDWVYRDRGLPDFKVDAAFPRPSLAGTWGVTVTVENLGAVGAEAPVTVRAQEGQRTGRVLVPAHDKAVVRVLVPTQPVEVIVNDGSVPESDLTNNRFNVQIPQRQP